MSFWKMNPPLARGDQGDLEDPEKQCRRNKEGGKNTTWKKNDTMHMKQRPSLPHNL